MPKYLFKANLSPEGLMGTLKEGGTSRRAEIEKETKDLGGTIEAFYYAFGETDAFVIADVPDAETAAAFSMAVTASGAGTVETIVLITPEQMDEAAQKTVHYRPPGVG
ncbi:MAG: GYD domain-containing protein [Acidimicrobiia bacterium]